MTPALAADLRRIAAIVGLATAAGWLLGLPALGAALGLALVVVRQLGELIPMHRWLHGMGPRPPRRSGLLGDIERQLDRLQRQARKRKKRLRKVANRFQQAAEANPDGAVILDRDAQIEWLNRAAGRLLGLRQGQDHGQLLPNLIRNPGFAEWLEYNEASEPFEIDSPGAEGQRLLMRVVPYGNSKRMLMVRDITRLHSLEQMRRDFVANVSHELRSPLTVIVGYLEGMRDDERLPDSMRRPVDRMSEQSARMSVIVDDLLRLSRIESDPGGAAYNPIDVASIVESVRSDAARLGSTEHELQIEIETGLLLLGEYNEIYSAFSNLVFNAVQYTADRGRIVIRWRGDETGARLDVEDDGVGIEAHHVPRLTERFYRVDKARSRALGGTGLGLAIVKHVLMRHDATLVVDSEPERGSTFSCRFPPSRIERAEAAAAAAASSAASV